MRRDRISTGISCALAATGITQRSAKHRICFAVNKTSVNHPIATDIICTITGLARIVGGNSKRSRRNGQAAVDVSDGVVARAESTACGGARGNGIRATRDAGGCCRAAAGFGHATDGLAILQPVAGE